jgi:two-component system capsular synthesis sensor histidine kinase RcsC
MRPVLVADDEPDIRLMLRTVLRPRGWRVEEVATGHEALERCRDEAFDAVILDHKMPGLTGAETARLLRAEGNGVPIILYSAYVTEDVEAEAAAAGVEAVAKEDLEGLIRALEAICAGEI